MINQNGMKEFKGTKGEWKLEKNSSFYRVKNDCEYEVGDKSLSIDVFLTLIKNKGSESISLIEENKANAQLIAAAPEMLEALQKCVAGMKILSTSNPKHKGLKADIEQAQEAINKALGL